MTDFWNEKHVFITGATGLVGSWLVKALLEKNAYVVALIRDFDPQSELFRSKDIERLHVVNGSLQDLTSLERALSEHEIDTVFHLAAQTIVGTAYRNPLETFEANVRGTYQLLEACRRQRHGLARIVIASSDKAYGTSDLLPYTEEMPLVGRYPYDVSKSCADLIALSYFHTYGMPIAISRCGNIYGGGDLNWSRIVPGTIKSLFIEEAPVIRSNGKFTRDYIFVKDIVNAYLLLAEKLSEPEIQGQAFNFSPERAHTVLEVVNHIQSLMDCAHLKPKILNSAKAEIKDQYLDCEKAKKLLGWNPQYSFNEGLQETIDWYLSYLENKHLSIKV